MWLDAKQIHLLLKVTMLHSIYVGQHSMPTIRISQEVFERLQRFAKPFVDTPNDVIGRLLDHYDGRLSPESSKEDGMYGQQNGALSGKLTEGQSHSNTQPEGRRETRQLDANSVTEDEIKWSKIVYAQVGNKSIQTNGHWSSLKKAIHQLALEHLGSFKELKKKTLSNIVEGQRKDYAWSYYRDMNISIQNQDAAACWHSSRHLAQELGLPIEVVFEWLYKPDAAFPGDRGRLSWEPGSPKKLKKGEFELDW